MSAWRTTSAWLPARKVVREPGRRDAERQGRAVEGRDLGVLRDEGPRDASHREDAPEHVGPGPADGIGVHAPGRPRGATRGACGKALHGRDRGAGRAWTIRRTAPARPPRSAHPRAAGAAAGRCSSTATTGHRPTRPASMTGAHADLGARRVDAPRTRPAPPGPVDCRSPARPRLRPSTARAATGRRPPMPPAACDGTRDRRRRSDGRRVVRAPCGGGAVTAGRRPRAIGTRRTTAGGGAGARSTAYHAAGGRHSPDVEAALEPVEAGGIPALAGGGRAAGCARRSARAAGAARWRRSSR